VIAASRLVAGALCLLLVACDTQNPPTPPQPTLTQTEPASPSRPPSLTPGPTGAAPSPTLAPTGSPTSSPSSEPSGDLLVTKTVPYATEGDCGTRVKQCQQFVDVYAPADAGPWPVVLMIHGRPRTPADMVELARAVALGGAVVFNADYRGVRPVEQKGWPIAIEDVACAMRFVRANAATYGGDASRIVLVGHSFGGYVGTLIALDGDAFDGDCLVHEGSALPSAWIGIDGNCLVGVPPPAHPLWSVFYGGSVDQKPQVWEEGDPLEHLGGNPGLVVRMIHERDDPIVDIIQPRTLVRELRDGGYDASLTVIEGDDHWGPLDLDAHAGEVSRDVILDVLGIDD